MEKDKILEILRSKLIEADNWNDAIPASEMHNIADEILLEIKNLGDIGDVIHCDLCTEESKLGNKVNKICTSCMKEHYV